MISEKTYDDPEIGRIRLVKSSASRGISIRVHPDDGVRVVIPRSLSYDEGLRFFVLKRAWVISTVEKQKRKISDAAVNGKAVPRLHDGVKVRTLLSEIVFVRGSVNDGQASVAADISQVEDLRQTGRTWLSVDVPVFRKTLSYSGRLPEEGSAELDGLLRNVLAEVLRTEAKLILPKRLEMLASRYGFRYSRMTVKHNSSNWGSCSVRGNINLNLNLVRLPEPLCDYVLLHELCHLRYPDHGPDFHDLLEKLCTDNVIRLVSSGDPYMKTLVRKINSSRAAQPVSRTLERELKGYRLV